MMRLTPEFKALKDKIEAAKDVKKIDALIELFERATTGELDSNPTYTKNPDLPAYGASAILLKEAHSIAIAAKVTRKEAMRYLAFKAVRIQGGFLGRTSIPFLADESFTALVKAAEIQTAIPKEETTVAYPYNYLNLRSAAVKHAVETLERSRSGKKRKAARSGSGQRSSAPACSN
jgi:hypothetical protein